MLTPRMLGAHLLAIVAVGIAVGLGVWQYDAWQERRAAEAVDLTQRDPVPLTDVLGPDDPFPGDQVGQPVELSGTWLPGSTVLVSDRFRDGERGFWVVTPVEVADSAVAVVRGWTASADDVPAAPEGPVDLVGWLQPGEGSGALDDDLTDDVFPQLRIADLAQRVDGDLYSAYAVAQEGVGGLPAADLEELPDAGRFTALRNLLYAFEWWVFAGFAAFIWWRFVRDALAEQAVGDPVASSV
ncbi:SURF1 family protein [Nocardioides sp.]|uniref:SURF1 family protein n=1 Tax=Nocardioides sp. TaxID=35761 RepID=UPI0027156ECD|nr:SURF1 family protein [Nocardioides sp.]MDO9458230.1 SURF1 family protein [Nocardioides sp.]